LDPSDHEQFISAGKLKKLLITKIFQSNPEQLLANTHHVALSMKKDYGLEEIPKVLHCGVDRSRILDMSGICVSNPTRSGAVRLVSIGSLEPIKGLLELKTKLEKTQNLVDWLIVGEGSLMSELAKPLAKDSKLSIHLVGSTSNPYPYLKNSDMLLHGGLSESFGVVLVEALMLGKPVIAHNSNGPLEIKRVTNSPMLYVGDLHFGDNLFKMISEFSSAKFPETSLDSVLSHYEISTVVDAWQGEFDSFESSVAG
jgi:glycosyltransferase involved in cell wall biosynthesis